MITRLGRQLVEVAADEGRPAVARFSDGTWQELPLQRLDVGEALRALAAAGERGVAAVSAHGAAGGARLEKLWASWTEAILRPHTNGGDGDGHKDAGGSTGGLCWSSRAAGRVCTHPRREDQQALLPLPWHPRSAGCPSTTPFPAGVLGSMCI